jgi:hypothetical protein
MLYICDSGHRVDAPFIRSLSARYPHKRKINESTLKQYGGSFSNHKRSYSLSGAAGKSQDVEVHTVVGFIFHSSIHVLLLVGFFYCICSLTWRSIHLRI